MCVPVQDIECSKDITVSVSFQSDSPKFQIDVSLSNCFNPSPTIKVLN